MLNKGHAKWNTNTSHGEQWMINKADTSSDDRLKWWRRSQQEAQGRTPALNTQQHHLSVHKHDNEERRGVTAFSQQQGQTDQFERMGLVGMNKSWKKNMHEVYYAPAASCSGLYAVLSCTLLSWMQCITLAVSQMMHYTCMHSAVYCMHY